MDKDLQIDNTPIELYHDIFGSVLDRTELTPYLLRNCSDYKTAIEKATLMLENRGFLIINGKLGENEKERVSAYVRQSIDYLTKWLFPTAKAQLQQLALLKNERTTFYKNCLKRIERIEKVIECTDFSNLIDDDPRNLFLMVSSSKYPNLFIGHPSGITEIPRLWRLTACGILKVCHIIKSVEEGSQDVYDFTSLGMYFEQHDISLGDLFNYNWNDKNHIPETENARRAFVLCKNFFEKLHASVTKTSTQDTVVQTTNTQNIIPQDAVVQTTNTQKTAQQDTVVQTTNTQNTAQQDTVVQTTNTQEKSSYSADSTSPNLIFNSGDGVSVKLVDIKARLKSPESMFTKLGKDASEEAYEIRDIMAITFLLANRDDSLTLFHALQKQGVILQENTSSTSITQTLYNSSNDMYDAIKILMMNLAKRENLTHKEQDSLISNAAAFANVTLPSDTEIQKNADSFWKALSINTKANPDSSIDHKKIQCKIKYSVPVQHNSNTYRIIVPGTAEAIDLESSGIITRQHTLPVELRISDMESWQKSELTGEAHHEAYKCRQLFKLLDRLFSPVFVFTQDKFNDLRKDQKEIYK